MFVPIFQGANKLGLGVSSAERPWAVGLGTRAQFSGKAVYRELGDFGTDFGEGSTRFSGTLSNTFDHS